ncbi:MAG TPA: VWA domain-containing protein [Blastocatellia bacterium]|nr:VWA domain-containing protein [Blastocatellia bacterium]
MALTGLLNLLVLLLFLTPVSPLLAPGQQPRQAAESRAAKEDDDVIKLNTRLVNLNIKVMDRSGRNPRELRREDFQVLEDGVPQEIAYFEPVEAPVNLLLLLDLSGSIGSKLELVRKAAKKFIDSLGRDDSMAVASFATRFKLISGFTTDRGLLKDRVDHIRRPGGDTCFYDATWSAFDLLREVKEARKALVILTDGVDSSEIPDEEGSDRSFDQLIERAVEEDVTIYPIYFDTEPDVSDSSYTPRIFSEARRKLEVLADQTGGTYFMVRRGDDLNGVYTRVGEELRTLYSLAYTPKDTRRDGQWRKIRITVNRPGFVARTRRGYYAK